MKKFIKKMMQRRGYQVYASHQLPVGFNWMLDAERLTRPSVITTIFDVGANEGQTAVPLAKRFSKAHIWCFEPLSATFKKLRLNTAHLSSIQTVNCALGGENKVTEIYPKADSEHNSLLPELNKPELSAEAVEKIQVCTVDEILVSQGIDRLNLLKTDTEGCDLEVLRGAKGALAAGRLDIIVSEIGFHAHLKRHTNLMKLQDFLAGYGYELYSIYDQNHYDARIDYANALFLSAMMRERCPKEYALAYTQDPE